MAGADLIVLSEHVDYWNSLGWKDPFSSPQYSARQQDYTNRYNFDGVYTPQLVVDGRYGFVGSDGKEASPSVHEECLKMGKHGGFREQRTDSPKSWVADRATSPSLGRKPKGQFRLPFNSHYPFPRVS